MNPDIPSEELFKISLDAVDENATVAWHSLIHNLSNSDLDKLQSCFKSKCNDDGLEIGLESVEFLNAICSIFGGPQYSVQANVLFDEICGNRTKKITWGEFLDFLIESVNPKARQKLHLKVDSIETVPHSKNESVAKIVIIETAQYFCYAIILKYGRVGLYDGNMNFLTSYHAIMTREDIGRSEDERRRRNRWISDALFAPDCLMLILTNSTRSIIIYEASSLNHVPYWLILGTPHILKCLAYQPFTKLVNSRYSTSALFCGQSNGEISSFTFLQPKNNLLRRKRNDNVSVFYWESFLKETAHVVVKTICKTSNYTVTCMQYVNELRLLVISSTNPESSIILKYFDKKIKSTHYKISKGVSCFDLDPTRRLLMTAGKDGIIRIWNIYIAKPFVFLNHDRSEVIDIRFMQNQNLLLSISASGILKIWDLSEHECLQTIKLNFPSFRIHGKVIEWGVKCIYPGPRRIEAYKRRSRDENEKEYFGLQEIDEIIYENDDANREKSPRTDDWERSFILVVCCNYIAKIQASFADAFIECSFLNPILPPPPLQNSVLVPSNWGVQSHQLLPLTETMKRLEEFATARKLEEYDFILNKNFINDCGTKSTINYKIALLETQKKNMRSKVALGTPYLALDLFEIQELKLSPSLHLKGKQSAEHYVKKIQQLLENAVRKDEIFSASEPVSSGSKSSKCSIVELPY